MKQNKKQNKNNMKEVLLWVGLAIVMLALVRYFNIGIHKAEASTIPASMQVKYVIPDRIDPIKTNAEVEAMFKPAKIELQGCDLSFISQKPADVGKEIIATPNSSFKLEISKYSCSDQQLFSKLGWYESEYNPDAVNTIYTGLFQESDETRVTCRNNGHGQDDFECAKWVYNNYRAWFESATTYNF